MSARSRNLVLEFSPSCFGLTHGAPPERFTGAPHTMQDNCPLARDVDFRLVGTDSLCQTRTPGLQRAPALGPSQQHTGIPVKVVTHVRVAALGDGSLAIHVAGLEASRRQSQARAHIARFREAAPDHRWSPRTRWPLDNAYSSTTNCRRRRLAASRHIT